MILQGVGASLGKVRARCVDQDAYQKSLEDHPVILVADFIPPTVTSLKKAVVGIVTEDGGLLSHAACIAREFGIPCVVGVEDAVRVLNGKEIEINGLEGTVYAEGY